MKSITEIIEDCSTILISGIQIGDEAKGHATHSLVTKCAADGRKVTVSRTLGGGNAGHTVVFDGKKVVLHSLPSSTPIPGITNIIGRGTINYPRGILGEMHDMENQGMKIGILLVSEESPLSTPWHLVFDRAKEARSADPLGTTGMGIGPTYRDKVARIGVKTRDLVNLCTKGGRDIAIKRIRKNYDENMKLFRAEEFDPDIVREILKHKILGESIYESSLPDGFFDFDNVITSYTKMAEEFKDLVTDTDAVVQTAIKHGELVIGEAAQALGLSVDHGLYPYVTSSDPSVDGAALGMGIRPHQLDYAMCVAKAYVTKVGNGPFMRYGHTLGEEMQSKRLISKEECAGLSVNSEDLFEKGRALGDRNGERGATTGRVRDVGPHDCVWMRYAAKFSGENLALMKLDAYDECEKVEIITSYTYQGEPYYAGGKVWKKGDIIKVALTDPHMTSWSSPNIEVLPGWMKSTRNARDWFELPKHARDFLLRISIEDNMKIRLVGVGPADDELIVI